MTDVERSDSQYPRPSRARRLVAERWRQLRRVFKQRIKLRSADLVVVSYGKSGRTWLAAMISHVYHQKYELDSSLVIHSDDFHRLHKEIPRIFFTHDQWPAVLLDKITPRLQRPLASLRHYTGKKVIWLVRDPRDVAVSAYFQFTRRDLQRYALSAPPPLFDYVTKIELPKILGFMQRWERSIQSIRQSLVIRYEDLRVRPAAELAKVMNFIGGEFAPETIERAVAFAAFENLRDKEESRFFASGRLRPSDGADPESFKVRRGKVGGYRDYLSPEELARIEAMLADRLPDRLGYRQPSAPAEVATG